jgi:hypothetical protein
MNDSLKQSLSKVPEVTLGFWIIKVAATTLGETGGYSVTMTLNWGYLIGTAFFLGLLIVLVVAQILAHKFHPRPLLGYDCRIDHLRHHHGRFRRPLARHRICRRLDRYCWSASPPCSASGTGRKAPFQ